MSPDIWSKIRVLKLTNDCKVAKRFRSTVDILQIVIESYLDDRSQNMTAILHESLSGQLHVTYPVY